MSLIYQILKRIRYRICDNKWKFKRIIKIVFRVLEKLKLKIAEDKMMIGRTSTKCFDFLGFNIRADGLSVSKKSIRKFAENIVMKLNLLEKPRKETFQVVTAELNEVLFLFNIGW